MEFTILLAYLLCYYAILFLSENILPQNGRKSRLSGTKRRVFSQFGFLSQRGRALNRLWVAINLRLTNEKQLGANKFIVTKLKDWISSINKHYARPDLLVRGGNTIYRKKEKAFTWNKTFKTFFFDRPPTMTDTQRSWCGIPYTRQLFGEANITALAFCDVEWVEHYEGFKGYRFPS